jgi:hypothetical protein
MPTPLFPKKLRASAHAILNATSLRPAAIARISQASFGHTLPQFFTLPIVGQGRLSAHDAVLRFGIVRH